MCAASVDNVFLFTMAASRVAVAGLTLPAWAQTAGRAVHVKIHPRPLDLAESREVLRVLQQYGEVIMYKQLKVRSSAIAFYSCALLNKSSILAYVLIEV